MPNYKVISRWQQTFLHHVQNGQPDNLAARLTGVSLAQVYRTNKADEDFAQKWAKAKEGRNYENRIRW